jgi:hypothetical protein
MNRYQRFAFDGPLPPLVHIQEDSSPILVSSMIIKDTYELEASLLREEIKRKRWQKGQEVEEKLFDPEKYLNSM